MIKILKIEYDNPDFEFEKKLHVFIEKNANLKLEVQGTNLKGNRELLYKKNQNIFEKLKRRWDCEILVFKRKME